jgi:AraC-like DNA-binding protein
MVETDFHKLSQVINESFNQNFYDYINTYRIEESKRLLQNPESEKYKIISIAYDSGFSTKSAFYNAFRKNTGITPGEYQKKVMPLSSKTICK